MPDHVGRNERDEKTMGKIRVFRPVLNQFDDGMVKKDQERDG